MCYYKLFVFQGCGHSVPSAQPIRPCATAVVIEREKWEGMRKAAEEKTRKRRSQGLRAKRNSTESELNDDGRPSSPSKVDPHTAPVCPNAAAAQHSTSPPPPIPLQPQQPRPETRQSGNDEDGIPPSATTQTSISGMHIARMGSEPSSTPSAAVVAAPNVGPAATTPSPCGTVLTHPFQTVKIYRSCALCTRNREELLAQSESAQPKVHFDDWRWKVRYLGPIPEESRSPGGMASGSSSLDWSQGIGEVMGSWVKPWKPMKTVQSLGGMLINPLPPLLSSPPPSPDSRRSKTHGKSRSDSEATMVASVVSGGGPWKKGAKAQSADLGRMGSRGGWPSS
ncbi:hypothetical protein DM02DRAFT_225453 [Periconia macrospinosa]|uniref:Uncharacterized protein n=1 Tax=Periconia macrospinosa TaxID=97972 RepID=A0A2V1DZY4_9PLEO|nr:hypothetical protein DM02DRAFT_225453 [Periconia macrospinosa]